MPAAPTLSAIAPEIILAIAEQLSLDALQALVRCNRFLYHFLLRFLYKRAIAARQTPDCGGSGDWEWNCLLHDENGSPWLGNARQVTLCLAAGMDVNMNVFCHATYTRLHLAARNRWNCHWPRRESKYKCAEEEEEVMRLLLAHGADVNAATKSGESPLHAATEYGNFNMTALLLDAGADVNKVASDGFTPLHFAVKYSGSLKMVALLLDHGADPNKIYSPLHFAMKYFDNPELLAMLLEHGADVDKANETGLSPLHYAVDGGHNIASIRILLEHGADPNKVDANLATPLHYCQRHKNMALLLKHGADPNKADIEGMTPLHYAAKCSEYDIVALLLEYGANPNLWVGRSPLQDALSGLKTYQEEPDIESDVFGIVRLLVKAGALVEILGETERDLVKTICERQTQPVPALVPAEPTPITPSVPEVSPEGEVSLQVREKEGEKVGTKKEKREDGVEKGDRSMR